MLLQQKRTPAHYVVLIPRPVAQSLIHGGAYAKLANMRNALITHKLSHLLQHHSFFHPGDNKTGRWGVSEGEAVNLLAVRSMWPLTSGCKPGCKSGCDQVGSLNDPSLSYYRLATARWVKGVWQLPLWIPFWNVESLSHHRTDVSNPSCRVGLEQQTPSRDFNSSGTFLDKYSPCPKSLSYRILLF